MKQLFSLLATFLVFQQLHAQSLSDTTGWIAAAQEPASSFADPFPDNAAFDKKVPDKPYHISWKVDAPIIGAGMAWTFYAFTKVYSKPASDSLAVERLDKNNLWVIDRWAAGKHSKEADRISNYPFYGCIPYPFLLLLDGRVRKDGLIVGALYLEAMAITGTIYTGTNYFVDRYRPEVYAKDVSIADRTNGNGKNAFPAGHPAMVATATFFAASLFDQYHAGSNWKWAGYGIAIAATGATIYLRHEAGKHFPSDLFVGTLVGVGSGMLVPRLHRYHPMDSKRATWNLSPDMPYDGAYGMALTCRLK